MAQRLACEQPERVDAWETAERIADEGWEAGYYGRRMWERNDFQAAIENLAANLAKSNSERERDVAGDLVDILERFGR